MPETIDDSGTGEFVEVKSNVDRPITLLSPDDSLKTFTLAKDFEANVFASEETFPDLRKPCQVAFDAKGRLWVCTMESYPMYLPGTPPNDKVLILEDTDQDGVADKQTIFAEGLHLPTGIELVPNGAYVAQQPNLMLLKDTDGDDKADVREYVLHGFDSADSHHSISAFTWGPGGDLYFQEGTFHHSQIETPYGPTRLANAGVFRYEPRREKLEVFVSYSVRESVGAHVRQVGTELRRRCLTRCELLTARPSAGPSISRRSTRRSSSSSKSNGGRHLAARSSPAGTSRTKCREITCSTT